VLFDIKEGFAEGKALDIMQCYNTVLIPKYQALLMTILKQQEVMWYDYIRIPRKPGMTREELIGINAGIVKTVVENVLKFSPDT
jgi:malate dehydrogenase